MAIKIRHSILTISIAGLLACNAENSKTTIQMPPKLIQTDTSDGTQYIALIIDSATKNVIPLTKNDLAIVDQQVKIAVNDYNKERDKYRQKVKIEDPTSTRKREDYLIDMKNYKRQYVAYLNTKKQKEVWVNCFCSNPDNDEWKSEIVEVRDGGNCYFNLKVNIKQKSYYEFIVNGRA